MTRGKFIAFEGVDGSGKTTQATLLAKRLGVEVLPSTEGLIGDAIRSALRGDIRLPSRGLQMLFTAGRLARSAAIEATLAAGHHVVADRWTMSGILYGSLDQPEGSLARERSQMWLSDLNQDVLIPDCYIILCRYIEESIRCVENRSKRELFENRIHLEILDRDYRSWPISRSVGHVCYMNSTIEETEARIHYRLISSGLGNFDGAISDDCYRS